MPPAATKCDLIDRVLGGTLRTYIANRRAANRSWAGIASDLRVDHDVEVSDDLLRLWYGPDRAADNA
jgi:hypothetical protein